MAKIFKTNEQEKALKDIVDSLKIIDSINTIMENEDIKDLKIRLTGTVAAGAVNELIPMPFSIISSQIKDYRKRLIKEVLDKSKTYSIRLEDDEKEILGIKTKKNEEEKTVTNEQKTPTDAIQPSTNNDGNQHNLHQSNGYFQRPNNY